MKTLGLAIVLGLMALMAAPPGIRGKADFDGHGMAMLGFLDVTVPPFGADPTGQRDSTNAIQAAIDYARDAQMVCFFPPGTYRVSATLECAQNAYDTATGRVRWTRDFPCVLVGSRRGPQRPRIFLAPRSQGFGDPLHPKVLLHFWARDFVHQKPFTEQDDTSMNQMLVGIDVVVGEGNAGAIAIRHRAAQGSGVQDCAIDVTYGHTGLQGGAGSGGSHVNVTVIGGRIGLDLREAQPAPTIAGIALIGQTERAILYDGGQTLAAVGLRIESSQAGPLIEGVGSGPTDAANGAITLVDSTLAFDKPRLGAVAIRMAHSLTLHNVYIRGASHAVEFGDGTSLAGNPTGWLHVAEFAHAVHPPLYQEPGSQWKFQFDAALYLDGLRRVGDVVNVEKGREPPADLQSRHFWDASFPNWEEPGAVNVREAPYGARGDALSDDTAVIQRAIDEHPTVFLPKGIYRITQPLVLKRGTRLLGVARHLSILEVDGSSRAFRDSAHPQPLVRTADDPEATSVLTFLGLSVPADAAGAYGLDWRCGRNSICRSINLERPGPKGAVLVDHEQQRDGISGVGQDHPMVVIAGNGGGRWYEFIQGAGTLQRSSYRHLLIEGTSQPLAIYQCNPEHSHGETNVEIRGASHVVIYGLKSEGNAAVIKMSDSHDVAVFGYGGNASALEGQALFLVERSSDFLFANLWQKPRTDVSRGDYFAGRAIDPRRWSMIRETLPSGGRVGTPPMERPVLYRRGYPSLLGLTGATSQTGGSLLLPKGSRERM
jgi:hypothetical protein